jgi:hypothetical protein
MENVGIFMTIWSRLRPFLIYYGHSVYFFPFWYVWTKKNLATLFHSGFHLSSTFRLATCSCHSRWTRFSCTYVYVCMYLHTLMLLKSSTIFLHTYYAGIISPNLGALFPMYVCLQINGNLL